MKSVIKIYFDMDGVLADFDKGLKDMCNMSPKDQAKATREEEDAVFDAIKNADHFYLNLGIVPGAKVMFNTLCEKFGDKCEILTGVPKPERNIPEATNDKIEWVKEKLSDKIKVHPVRRAEKKNYCKGPEYILIDDYQKNIDEWEKQGGTGILFKDAEQALKEVLDYADEGVKENTSNKNVNELKMSGLDVIKRYNSPDCTWLPMVSLCEMIIPDRNEYGEVNIAWNAGLLEENRPFFSELWSSGCITMLTIYVCSNGIENKTEKEMNDWFERIGYYKMVDDTRLPQIETFSDGKGNNFFSINICVGVEDSEAYIEGGKVYPLKILNEYNQSRIEAEKNVK